MGDMGCHTCNMPFMGLKMGARPRSRACAPISIPVTYPAWATVEYDFPARGELPPIKVYWYEGHFGFLNMKTRGKNGAMAPDRIKNLPPIALFKAPGPSDSGSLTVGDKGTLYSPQDYGGSWMSAARRRRRNGLHEGGEWPRDLVKGTLRSKPSRASRARATTTT